MAPTALSAQETQSRFGVSKAIKAFPSKLSEQEEKNVQTVLHYMAKAYSPKENTGGSSVTRFCAPNNTFEAPSTFPTAHTAEEYAEAHSHVMSSLQDLHIVHFDVITAKGIALTYHLILRGVKPDDMFSADRSLLDDFVSLRYTATGSHHGESHNGIEATGRSAEWTAQGSFVLDEQNLIKHWWKDWNKAEMWKKLGWMRPENDDVEFA